MPALDDIVSDWNGSTTYSGFDLTKTYHQLVVKGLADTPQHFHKRRLVQTQAFEVLT